MATELTPCTYSLNLVTLEVGSNQRARIVFLQLCDYRIEIPRNAHERERADMADDWPANACLLGNAHEFFGCRLRQSNVGRCAGDRTGAASAQHSALGRRRGTRLSR